MTERLGAGIELTKDLSKRFGLPKPYESNFTASPIKLTRIALKTLRIIKKIDTRDIGYYYQGSNVSRYGFFLTGILNLKEGYHTKKRYDSGLLILPKDDRSVGKELNQNIDTIGREITINPEPPTAISVGSNYHFQKHLPRFIPYAYASRSIVEDYIDIDNNTFRREKVKKHCLLNNKINIIQYKDGKSYIFLDTNTVEIIDDNKSELIEGWIVSDDRMILRYSKGALVKVLTPGKANDMFIVIDIRKGESLGSFKGRFDNEYMEYGGDLFPWFDQCTDIKQINIEDNLALLEILLQTNKDTMTDIIGEVNSMIDELEIIIKMIEVPIDEIPTWGKEYNQKLKECDNVLERYDTLQKERNNKTGIITEEDSRVKKLRDLSSLVHEGMHSNKETYKVRKKEVAIIGDMNARIDNFKGIENKLKRIQEDDDSSIEDILKQLIRYNTILEKYYKLRKETYNIKVKENETIQETQRIMENIIITINGSKFLHSLFTKKMKEVINRESTKDKKREKYKKIKEKIGTHVM